MALSFTKKRDWRTNEREQAKSLADDSDDSTSKMTTKAVPRKARSKPMNNPIRIFVQHVNQTLVLLFALLMIVIAPTGTSTLNAQEPTAREKKALRLLKTNIDRAGKQYKVEKLDTSQRYINQAIKQVEALSTGASAELLDLIKPEYERLKVAHKLLTDAGQTLDPLKPLPAPPADMGNVSFKSAVAPILVAKCGNCHVTRNRGDFSSASFEALTNSTMIAFGLPQDSRLIEVIESGEMPKGNLKVEPAELATLKAWIQQGAKFDGEDPKLNLSEYASDATTPNRNRRRNMEAALPTGNETVSFGLHIAPILIENCGTCHMNDNPRGNLNMGTFRTLLTGGDAGSPLAPGKSKDSFLFKRIESGEMPPNGKLDAKLIGLIGKWIDEGAKFDGGNVRLPTRTVAAKVKADSQSHDELVADRQALSEKTWTLVMDDVEAISIGSDNFTVVGSTTESRLTDVSHNIEKMVPKISSALRSDSAGPFVKGNVTVMVFDRRYDFSEFGKMVEQLDFPKEVSGYWGYTTIDAYATVLMTRNKNPDDINVSLAQQLAAVHVANLAPDVPRWFADGVGYWTAKKLYSKDETVKSWDVDAKAAAASMIKPDDFIQNKMPADKAALVAYLFVRQLKSDSSRFNKLMKAMRDGGSFSDSFGTAFGMQPEQMFGKMK